MGMMRAMFLGSIFILFVSQDLIILASSALAVTKMELLLAFSLVMQSMPLISSSSSS
jgi:hypothetical protein